MESATSQQMASCSAAALCSAAGVPARCTNIYGQPGLQAAAAKGATSMTSFEAQFRRLIRFSMSWQTGWGCHGTGALSLGPGKVRMAGEHDQLLTMEHTLMHQDISPNSWAASVLLLGRLWHWHTLPQARPGQVRGQRLRQTRCQHDHLLTA